MGTAGCTARAALLQGEDLRTGPVLCDPQRRRVLPVIHMFPTLPARIRVWSDSLALWRNQVQLPPVACVQKD